MAGRLFLIPSGLGESEIRRIQPDYNREVINSVHIYIVENVRTARRFLIKAGIETRIDDLTFHELNKHTKPEDLPSFLKEIDQQDIGLLSEAGTPCIADPGAQIVWLAQQQHIEVVPLIGASSIYLALMASGLNGQNFAFNGYLPISDNERIKEIKKLTGRSSQEKQTQIFIETPYRNMKLFADLIHTLPAKARLTIGSNITLPNENITTMAVYQWKKQKPDLHKTPAIFLFQV
ncbi:MAG: SAM-dependent methyltransferase [Bacteroidetes bacterium]|jgi:16S rRNA (cytidine1402-2'-O)-methyltransferase|nr:SAM-dependent methyltransferase [Bacteroidota bacterium]